MASKTFVVVCVILASLLFIAQVVLAARDPAQTSGTHTSALNFHSYPSMACSAP